MRNIITFILSILSFLVFLNFFKETRSGTINGSDEKLDLFITFEEIDVNSNKAKIKAKLSYTKVRDINYGDKIDMRINSGPISQINDFTFGYVTGGFNRTVYTFFTNPKEVRVVYTGAINEIIYDTENLIIEIDDLIGSSFYPFDRYKINLHFSLFDSKGRILHPNIQYQFDDQYLKLNSVSKAKNARLLDIGMPKDSLIDSTISLNLSRSMNHVLLFICVLLLAFSVVFWVYNRVKNDSQSKGTNFEILVLNITLILTFPDLRNFVIPENLNFSLLFDYSIILIWLLTIYSSYLTIKYQKEGYNPNKELQSNKEQPSKMDDNLKDKILNK